MAAYTAGNYEDALGYFNRSYQLSNRPKLLYNIGQAADRLRRDQEALDAFKEYLTQVPDAPNRFEVENRIKALEKFVENEKAAEAAPAPAAPAAPAAAPATPEKGAPEAQEPTQQNKPASPYTSGGEKEPQAEGGGIFSKWWFWTAAGVVVAGAAVGIAIAAGSKGEKQEEPTTTKSGVVVTTLRVAP